MFARMLVRGALVRRGRAASALLAVVVAAAVATAMMNLYVDVQAKLRKEFRRYGANIVVVVPDGKTLAPDTLHNVETTLNGHGLAVPFAYAVAKKADGSPVVVAGTDTDRAQRLNSWWSVSQWPKEKDDALVGSKALAVVMELAPADKNGAYVSLLALNALAGFGKRARTAREALKTMAVVDKKAEKRAQEYGPKLQTKLLADLSE